MTRPTPVTRRTLLAGGATLALSNVGARSQPATIIEDATLSYPEGLDLDGDTVRVVDIATGAVITYDTTTFQRVHTAHLAQCWPTSIARLSPGSSLITCHLANAVITVANDTRVLQIAKDTTEGFPITTPNDCTPDGRGGAFVTSAGLFDRRAPRTGAVLHVDASLRATTLARGLHYANGIAYDPRTHELFFTEHFDRRIWRFTLDDNLQPTDKKIIATIPPVPPKQGEPPFDGCGPDNLRRRRDGNIQVPMYGEGRLLILTRAGETVSEIELPCRYVTDTGEREDGAIVFTGALDLSSRQGRGMLGLVPATAVASERG